MKKLLFVFLGICIAATACAQDAKTVKLNAPNKNRGESVMKALEKRQSTREYSDRQLSTHDISDLVWAANGMNRPEESKRTAPTAMNCQEIDLYVCMADGAYIYDAKAHELKLITKEDVRPHLAGSQPFAKEAPVILLIVADLNRIRNNNEQGRVFAALDAGIVSQNISIFCAGCGFATVPRGFMDKEKTAAALGLGEMQHLMLNHPVGYFK